jgi:sugar phosphate isomerase/epimerase
MTRLLIVFLVFFGDIFAATLIAEEPPFFAMNTIARGGPDVVPQLLKEFGYNGLGGAAGDDRMAKALEAEGLRFFNGYHTMSFVAEQPAVDDKLRKMLDGMQHHDTALWLAIQKVHHGDKIFEKSSTAADDIAITKLREIADYAEPRGVKIALYPHSGFWLERVDDALRIADKLDRNSVGMTFNLCHWLKVEGSERDVTPVLKLALPRLMFVTINGADTGDTKPMGWDRLIQPLDAGSYDVAKFVSNTRAIGYHGPFGFQGFGIQAEPREVLQRTMKKWREILANSK